LRLVAAQHREARPLLAPGERVEVERGARERARLAGREVDQVDAVAEPVYCIDGKGEMAPGVVERKGAGIADVTRGARRELPQNEIGAIVRRVGRVRLVRSNGEPTAAVRELEARRVRHGELLATPKVEELEPARRRRGGPLPALGWCRGLGSRRRIRTSTGSVRCSSASGTAAATSGATRRIYIVADPPGIIGEYRRAGAAATEAATAASTARLRGRA